MSHIFTSWQNVIYPPPFHNLLFHSLTPGVSMQKLRMHAHLRNESLAGPPLPSSHFSLSRCYAAMTISLLAFNLPFDPVIFTWRVNAPCSTSSHTCKIDRERHYKERWILCLSEMTFKRVLCCPHSGRHGNSRPQWYLFWIRFPARVMHVVCLPLKAPTKGKEAASLTPVTLHKAERWVKESWWGWQKSKGMERGCCLLGLGFGE